MTKGGFCYIINVNQFTLGCFMKKCLLLLLVGLLAVALLTSCRNDPSETNWYKDWFDRDETTTSPVETTTEPEETTAEPEETTTEPADITEPEETTLVPEETTTGPEETTTEPEETTTAPAETTTEPDWNWDWDYDDDYNPPAVTTTKPDETTLSPEETTLSPEETTAPDEGTDPSEIYTITFVLNGGTLPSGAVSEYSAGMSVILPRPTRENFSFAGWYEQADLSGHAVTVIATGSVGNRTFYAKWETSAPGLWFPIIPLPSGTDK